MLSETLRLALEVQPLGSAHHRSSRYQPGLGWCVCDLILAQLVGQSLCMQCAI